MNGMCILVMLFSGQLQQPFQLRTRAVPDELQFACNSKEFELEEILARVLLDKNSSMGDRGNSAKRLWRYHTMKYAQQVLAFAKAVETSSDPQLRSLREEIDRDFTLGRIVELIESDFEWAAWLMVLAPRPEYSKSFLEAMDRYPGYHGVAILALGKMKAAKGFQRAIALLKDDNYLTVGLAARSLGYFGKHDAESYLIELLERNDWVSLNACLSLGEIGANKAIVALKGFINNNNESLLPLVETAQRAIELIDRRLSK